MKLKNSKSVISLSELKEIQNIIDPAPTKEELRKSIDIKLRKISQEKIAKWKNSLQNENNLRLEREKNEFIKKERLRQKIDEEERKYQNMRYNLSMQKAREYLFNSKDLVKSFNSSMLYSDTLKERDKQIELNRSIKMRKEKDEQDWIKKEKEQMLAYDMKELEKKKLRRNKSEAEMNIIRNQFNEVKYKRLQEMQDNYIEGEIIKREARNALLEEQKKKEMIKLARIKQNEEFVKLNEELKKNLEKRKQKEQEKFNEKLKRQQKLIDVQFENLKRIKEEQEKKESKDVEIKMNKDENEEKMRIEKRNKILKEMEEQRLENIKRKEENKIKEKIEEMKEIEEIRKKINEEREKEKNEYLMKRKKVKDLHEYYKKQVEDKKKLAFNDFVFERQTGLYNKEMMNREEDEFLQFAQENIKKYREQGKNIVPMLLELKKYKKNNNLQ